MYSVRVDPDAYHDIDEIIAWYESQKQGLGIDFLVKLDEAIASLKQNPFLYTIDFFTLPAYSSRFISLKTLLVLN